VTKNTPFSGQYALEIANIRTMIDLAGISMLYAHLLHCSETKMRRELEAVQNALEMQYKQYKQWRESINMINYKYHDLKHQIQFLRSEPDDAKRNSYLDQMEDDIKNYELQNKTGNAVLDTVLTGKSLYCDKHGITLTTVVDGKLLEFMDAMDICSIFGNALDNAIESELKIPVKEKRLVHLTVKQQKNFLMIRVENYFEGDLKFKAGSLATTKKEKGFHGYGIKSIKYTVNKYGGAVGITAENNWFDLEILIPIQAQAT
jgi:sensor histidine kinase regulating citrate/malate metabolism